MSRNNLLYFPAAHPGNTWNSDLGSQGESGYGGKDTFPLQRGDKDPKPGVGSEGNIGDLQRGLQKLGATIVDDGIFGAKTEAALKSKGYSVKVDHDTYNKIIADGGGSSSASGGGGKKNFGDTLSNILAGAGDFYNKLKKKDGTPAGDGGSGDGGSGDGGRQSGGSNTLIYASIGVVFLLIIIVLVVVLNKKKEGKAE